MKIVRNMFDRLIEKLPMRKRDKSTDEKKTVALLLERINGLENKINLQKTPITATASTSRDMYEEMNDLLQSEIRSRQRLERKMAKTKQKMDTLAAEFHYLQTELQASTVDLDLEKRKNAELRKRVNTAKSHRATRTEN